MMQLKRGERYAVIRELACRPDGVSSHEASQLLGLRRQTLYVAFDVTAKRYGLVDIKTREELHGQSRVQRRLFGSQADADAWQAVAIKQVEAIVAARKDAHRLRHNACSRRRHARERALAAERGKVVTPRRRPAGSAVAVMIEMAWRPDGVTSRELAERLQISQESASARLGNVRMRGELFAARHAGHPVRNFPTKEAAENYVPPPLPVKVREVRDPVRVARKTRQDTTPGVSINRTDLQRTGEIIVTSATKITVCPSIKYDPRYQVDPAMRVVGGFATAGIGRYLEGAAA